MARTSFDFRERLKMNIIRIALVAALSSLTTHAGAALNIYACVPEWAALAKELGGD